METKIYCFIKCEHFLKRQWERGIQDALLYKILQNRKTKKGKRLLVVFYSFFEKIGIKAAHLKTPLVLVIDHCVLITAFLLDENRVYADNFGYKQEKEFIN